MVYEHLEPCDSLTSVCQCGKPARFIYWGFEAVVCSRECADAMDAALDEWFRKHHDEHGRLRHPQGCSCDECAPMSQL